jgi:hypothetical protein
VAFGQSVTCRATNNTLIFVIEHDPQDGADDVSGDRSLAFIIGRYLKQKAVVSPHYATFNMLSTIEDVQDIETLRVHDGGVPRMAGFRYHLCATLKRTNQCEDRKLSIGTCCVTDCFGCPCRTEKYTPIMCPQRGLI